MQFAGVMPSTCTRGRAPPSSTVSHMGQVLVRVQSGDMAAAAAALETLIPASIVGLAPHRQRDRLFTDDDGGILDDLMISHHGDRFLLVVNAARTRHDLSWLARLDGVTLEHVHRPGAAGAAGAGGGARAGHPIPAVVDTTFMDSLPRSGRAARCGCRGRDTPARTASTLGPLMPCAERFARAPARR